MSKKNKFKEYMKTLSAINHNERVEEAARQDTVQIYSVLAMSLFDLLDGTNEENVECINLIFAHSLELWTDCVESGTDVVAECEKRTGIKFVYDEEK